jgi:hypothetical protein
VFSVIWGICFSLKANPNGMKRSDSGTLLAQGKRLRRVPQVPGLHLGILTLPGAPGAGVAPGGFDFAFFSFFLRPPAPFIPRYCRSPLNFPRSLLIT